MNWFVYIRGSGHTKPLGFIWIISELFGLVKYPFWEVNGMKKIHINIKIDKIKKKKSLKYEKIWSPQNKRMIKKDKKMAGVEGLEPSQAVLETDVLPLTLYPYVLI